MTPEDRARENRIDEWFMKLQAAKTPDARRVAFSRMCSEIRERSQCRVAEMESEKGLR